MSKRESGFTLLELLIVIAVMGLILAFVLPMTTTWLVKHRTNVSAQEVAMLLQRARILAISRSQLTRVKFDTVANPSTAALETEIVVDPLAGTRAWKIWQGKAGVGVDTTEMRAIVTLSEGTKFTAAPPEYFFQRNGQITSDKPGAVPIAAGTFLIFENQHGYQRKVELSPGGKIRYVGGSS